MGKQRYDTTEFVQLLEKHMDGAQLSYRDLTKKLNLYPTALSRWLSGEMRPRLELIPELTMALELSRADAQELLEACLRLYGIQGDLPHTAKPKVFVSHSSIDAEFASRLVNDVNAAGADAWMDVNDLGAGNFQRGIDEALATCEWFVLVLTRNALASEWVRDEVYAANRLKKLGKIKELIFIKASDLDHSEMPAMWGNYNVFDATKDYRMALDRILKELGLTRQIYTTPVELPPSSLESLESMAHVWAVRERPYSEAGHHLEPKYRVCCPYCNTLDSVTRYAEMRSQYSFCTQCGKQFVVDWPMHES